MRKLAILLLIILLLETYSQETEDAAYLNMRRTACLVLSRYHSNTHKESIEATVQALPPADQNKYINKLYATAVLKCEEAITQSEVQEVDISSFSSTLKTPTSTPQDSSTLSKESTTPPLPATFRSTRSKKPWSSSSRSSTRRCRSRRKSERPRRKRPASTRSMR